MFEMGIDRKRPAVGFERMPVVADLLQDGAKAGKRAEMARLASQHYANVSDGALQARIYGDRAAIDLEPVCRHHCKNAGDLGEPPL